MGVILFNGQSSKDYHIEVEQPPQYAYAEKAYDVISIPGRNGDLYIDTDSYKNVDRKYNISLGSVYPEYTRLMVGLTQWLHSASGYARLEDSYEPEYYRMAVYKESGDFSNLFHQAGKGTITFTCKPQRFLKSGEKSYIYNFSGIAGHNLLRNPTTYASRPLLKVTLSNPNTGGEVRIENSKGLCVLMIKDSSKTSSYTYYIDCDMQDVYDADGNNCNHVLEIVKDNYKEFPELTAGVNDIGVMGVITKLEVVPRWWVL